MRDFRNTWPVQPRIIFSCFKPLTPRPFAVPPDAEGDGGVIYNGMDLSGGYGMQYLHNFIHHTLEIPGLHGRGGIYFVRRARFPSCLTLAPVLPLCSGAV